MVELSIRGDELHLEIKGWDKLWSLRSEISVALDHIREARPLKSPEELREIMKELGFGVRVPGTSIPKVITAGTYYYFGTGRIFMDVHHPIDSALLIELEDEPFRKLIVDVDDPDFAISLIEDARARATRSR